MIRKFMTAGLCLLLLALIVPGTLRAAEEVADERDLTRVRKKVEALRAWQLTEALELDEATASRLFPALREADEERWRIELTNRRLVRDMARLLKEADPQGTALNRILDDLQANRRELARAEERHMEKIREILPPDDVARYLMFQLRFQRELKQKAAQAYDEGRVRRNSPAGSGEGGSSDNGSGAGDGGGGDGGGGAGGSGSGGSGGGSGGSGRGGK